MKKVFALIIATALCVATLTACGSKTTTPTTSNAASTPTTSASTSANVQS